MATINSPFARPLDHPLQSVIIVFLLWKALLLAIAILAPGPGYDTSTTLIQPYAAAEGHQLKSYLTLGNIANKLTRWDAIYFTKVAHRGYLFEQEWAFNGAGWTRLIRYCADLLQSMTTVSQSPYLESLAGTLIAHAAHGAAVLCIHSLVLEVFATPRAKKLALVTAVLHVLSPAGMFLSAPYGESYFALLSFIGYILFARGLPVSQPSLLTDGMIIFAGAVFGISTTVRSNGILNGMLFLEEAVRATLALRDPDLATFRRLGVTITGGILVGAGFVIPQLSAFFEYCGDLSSLKPDAQEWCYGRVPSIYSFVQSRYWGVGFMRYWTASNIPLFIIASPMLVILIHSSTSLFSATSARTFSTTGTDSNDAYFLRTRRLLRSFAAPQLALAVMAITNYHVQIINRISSAYPVWYIWFALAILRDDFKLETSTSKMSIKQDEGSSQKSSILLKVMVMYALIQGGLFASFLPPA